ncbi:Protein FAR1-RELATED SEQUENCE 7 [Bienertia sinuspersici]
MDEVAVDNMLNASMENMAEAAVANMAEASVDNMAELAVDMCFVTGEEFAVFCHDYAYRKGFTFYTRTTELMKEYKEMGVGQIAAELKEPMYHMMKKNNNNDQAGISITKSYNSLLVESGGHENITYNQRDVRNVVHLNWRKSRLEGDVVALEKYFQQQYEYNQDFYSAIERDDDECDALKLVSESKKASLGGLSVYQAVEKFPKPVWKKRWKTFIVSCDKDKGDFSCSCKLFEFRGILCRHIIKIIEFEDVNDIVRPYEEIRVSYYDLEEFGRVKRVRELS